MAYSSAGFAEFSVEKKQAKGLLDCAEREKNLNTYLGEYKLSGESPHGAANMKTFLLLCILPIICMCCPEIISRQEWNAKPPRNGNIKCMSVRSQNVLIHHTFIPPICKDKNVCMRNMYSMQTFHQDTRKWSDIGYNFCIGGDGKIYEGRGWGVVAYPAKGYEFNSTSICFIGDYTQSMPTEKMLQAAINLIECGIVKGFIEEDPNVLGIRELIPTTSPGDKLQSYITRTRFGYPRNIYSNKIIY